MSATKIQVAVGAYDLTKFTGSRTTVKSIRIHPQFSSTSLYNDIALVELGVPSAIQPIALFSEKVVDKTPPSLLGKLVTVLGWGLADPRPPAGTMLRFLPKVGLPVVADSSCNDIYSNPVLPSQFCAAITRARTPVRATAAARRWCRWTAPGYMRASFRRGALPKYFGWYGKYTPEPRPIWRSSGSLCPMWP